MSSGVLRLMAIGVVVALAACGGHSSRLSYSVGGSISGLSTDGLVLQNNAGNNLTIAANTTSFQFLVAARSNYNITVATQPTGLICTVSHGTGTSVRAPIVNVSIVCNANTHTIAGTISGLTTNGLVLQNNGADNLTIAANATTFQFATPIAAGGGYNVTSFAQPVGLTCSVNNGVGSDVNTDITNINIVCSAITFTVGGTISGLTGSGLVLQNNGGDDLTIAANATAFEFTTPIAYGSGYAITVLTQPVGLACLLTNAAGTATAQVSNVGITCAQTAVVSSVSTVALSVNNTGLNAALTGAARQITLTNVGSIAATNLSISYPVWPTGTVASTSCGNALAAAASCTITITPGTTATSNCDSGIAPTPGIITVSADDAPDSTIDAVVLSYGCIYQAGFIYAIDDATPATGGIGGKVVALTDQAAAFPTGIVWSSDGSGSVDNSVILGIDETSTASTPSPTSPTYPPGTPAYTACDGSTDGACNTSNIVSYYNFNRAVGGSAPTPLNQYGAGICRATIDGYSDWYLPAICEAGYGGAPCGTSSSPLMQNMQSNLVDAGIGNLSGVYWSSTEYSAAPQLIGWAQDFEPAGGSAQFGTTRDSLAGVRCTRVLTQ